MARSPTKQSSRVDVNTFAQGLITEASPLNFPPNASVAEENFEINRDGTRDRRRGMDLEPVLGLISTGRSPSLYNEFGSSTFLWTSASGDAGVEFVVVQVQNEIYLFNTKTGALAAEGYVGSVKIIEFPLDRKFSFAVVDGYLVVVAGGDACAVVEYTNPGFEYKLSPYLVRDVWGVEIVGEGVNDNYEIDDNYRGQGDLSERIVYNLQNQSWGIPRRQGLAPDPEGVDKIVDPLPYFNITHDGRWPSNSETVSSGLQYKPVQAASPNTTPAQPTEQMFPYLYDDLRGNTQKAAKGYFIINLMRRGESRVAESIRNRTRYPVLERSLNATNQDFTPIGATVVRQFAGRAFFAGFSGAVIEGDKRSPNLSNCIVFTQVVKSISDLSKCYQEGDPTSREGNDIVDTDGGFIKIAGADRIIGLRALGSSLIVFASNGVWKITGGSDYGFGATNHKVDKLSSVGIEAADSIVEEVGRVYYWAKDGIYTIGPDQFESLKVDNISQKTIQSFYEDLPSISKERSMGAYDLYSKKVKWIYNMGLPFTNSSQCMELVFDTVIGSFSLNRIGRINNVVEVTGLFVASPYIVGTEAVDVMVGTDSVSAGSQAVVVDEEVRTSSIQAIKYVALTDQGGVMHIGFSYYNNRKFKDWERISSGGVDAKAFLISGAQTVGDSAVDKQIPYIFMHFRRTETGISEQGVIENPSGCLMRSQWDFANTINSKKWGPLVQTYRYVLPRLIQGLDYDSGFEILTTKNKLRGRGKAFALYIESEPGKDCRILGWNISINGNAVA